MPDKDAIISDADVTYVAKLAHLSFTPEEAADCRRKLGSILEYMQELQTIDTTDIPPTTHALPLTNVFREDVPGPTLSREEALANAPDRTEDSFRVPRIL